MLLVAATPLTAAAQEDDAEEDETSNDDDTTSQSDEEELDTAPDSDFQLDLSALGSVDPAQQLKQDSTMGKDEASAQAVEAWTERELELLELHGYFRVRPELYHQLNIRDDAAVYPLPANLVVKQSENYPSSELGLDCREDGSGTRKGCTGKTTAGANLRLRLEPTLNVSEEIRVKAQLDFLDNVMMGSTPRYYQNYGAAYPSAIETGRLQGWDMGPPSSGQAIVVRRAWGEVMTPLGQLRFGRMGDHFGLGMLHNAGNGVNNDFGDTVDRLMFAAKLNDWLIAPAFDFPNEGVSAVDASGRPFDLDQLDDAWQLAAIIAYKHDAEQQQAMLRRGEWLINTGLYFTYRWQVMSFEMEAVDPAATPADDTATPHFYRRDMWAITPDLWFQLLYKTFHLETELALVYGQVGNPDRNLADFNQAQELTLLQYGGVLQVDYGLLSDQLRIGLELGFASGDKQVEGLRAPATYDQLNDPGNTTYSAFSFNPAYNTDAILYHHIMGSVSQSYYFHPWLRYDFFKSALGKRLGLQADVVYSRAVFKRSTINNGSNNLGLELNASAQYVSQDGFHAGLQYGVMFPLRAFEGTPYDGLLDENPYSRDLKMDIPQTIQVMLGISF